jgi:hypothetical protein
VDGSFASGLAYRDREGDGSLHRLLPTDREAYRAARDAHFDAVAAGCRQRDIPLTHARIEQPLETVLRAWLRVPGARR